jgi:hypothetical protein
MPADDDRVLVCMPISEMPVPPVPSRRGKCSLCGDAVWIAQSSPRGVRRRHCKRCIELELGPLHTIEDIAPLSAAQVTELLAVLKRQRS